MLSVTGPKFINWTCGLGGGGAIDLAMHLRQRGFMEALAWLEQHFAGAAPPSATPPGASGPLQLPAPDPQTLGRVQSYLTNERRLPPARIEPLIRSGRIYADAKANAVFLLWDSADRPVGAELRGTTLRPWKGMAPGSQKDLGCFSVGPADSPAVILCESAIDALSCSALHPQPRCLSTAGARSSPLWLAPLLHQGREIYCGYDADATGDLTAQAMQLLHPQVRRLRPSKKDWNDVLKAS